MTGLPKVLAAAGDGREAPRTFEEYPFIYNKRLKLLPHGWQSQPQNRWGKACKQEFRSLGRNWILHGHQAEVSHHQGAANHSYKEGYLPWGEVCVSVCVGVLGSSTPKQLKMAPSTENPVRP